MSVESLTEKCPALKLLFFSPLSFACLQASPAVSLYPCTRCNLASDRSEFCLLGTRGLAAHCGPSGHQVRCVVRAQSPWHATRKPRARHLPGLLIGLLSRSKDSSTGVGTFFLFVFFPESCSTLFHCASFHLVSLQPSLSTTCVTGRVSQQCLSTVGQDLSLLFSADFHQSGPTTFPYFGLRAQWRYCIASLTCILFRKHLSSHINGSGSRAPYSPDTYDSEKSALEATFSY